jgi:hypothetical protein
MPMMQSAPGAETIIDGKRYTYFAGTGYLGLQGHPEVLKAAAEAVYQYGVSSATSRTGFGNNPPTIAVEEHAAAYFGAEAAFYYISGYVGNAILALHLRDRFDVAFVDEFAHYSVLEGVAQAQKPVYTFRHCDPEDAGVYLSALRPGRPAGGAGGARGGRAAAAGDERRGVPLAGAHRAGAGLRAGAGEIPGCAAVPGRRARRRRARRQRARDV